MGNAYSCNDSRMGKSWGELFKDNMNSMGLPAPQGLYLSAGAFLTTTGALLRAVERFGPTATVAEVTTTGSLSTTAGALDLVTFAGTVVASGYVGAMIGSAFTATVLSNNCQGIKRPPARGQMGRKNRFKKTDLIAFAKDNNIYASWLDNVLEAYPEIYDEVINVNRKSYALRIRGA